jgi:hypothetical protein
LQPLGGHFSRQSLAYDLDFEDPKL